VLAFPTNDFRQEKGTNEEIEAFVKEHYPDANFPIFSKSSLQQNPVYQTLKKHVPGTVKGNFFKYLVGRDGVAVSLFTKKMTPFSFETDIANLLAE